MPCSPARRDTFSIVTAYEDFAAGLRAKELVARLTAELKSGFKVTSEFWRFDFLEVPPLGEYAMVDAARADLIIISCRGDEPLPAHMKTWITSWLPAKTRGLAALVALLHHGEAAEEQGQRSCSYLRNTATKGRMDFFCKAGDWQRERFQYAIYTQEHESNTHSAGAESTLQRELVS